MHAPGFDVAAFKCPSNREHLVKWVCREKLDRGYLDWAINETLQDSLFFSNLDEMNGKTIQRLRRKKNSRVIPT